MTIIEKKKLKRVVVNIVKTMTLKLKQESVRALSCALSLLSNNSADLFIEFNFSKIKSFSTRAAYSSFHAKITNVVVSISYITPPKINSGFVQN
jgi:hypothetical protein